MIKLKHDVLDHCTSKSYFYAYMAIEEFEKGTGTFPYEVADMLRERIRLDKAQKLCRFYKRLVKKCSKHEHDQLDKEFPCVTLKDLKGV